MDESKYYMQLAIDEAWKYQLQTYPNPAVGAVIVKNNQILAISAHKKAGEPHAEVNACKEAFLSLHPTSSLHNIQNSFDIHNFLYENHNGFFHDCSIYVTLEPCNHTGRTPACSQLLEKLRFKNIYIGTLDPNKKASGGYERLKNISNVKIDILKKKCDELLLPFSIWQERSFVFFKLAMRSDGSIDGGYITTKDSLTLVHKLRDKIDLLVIGGNTVRIDRPTLDTRFIEDGNNPDILIYSNSKQFDPAIPLFNIPNRSVNISNCLDNFHDKSFIMIEGGYQLLEKVSNKCDIIMLFISHKDKNSETNMEKLENFSKLHSFMINEDDEVIFLKTKD